jgi:hypothetical protein
MKIDRHGKAISHLAPQVLIGFSQDVHGRVDVQIYPKTQVGIPRNYPEDRRLENES